jgi:hypothetical protein
MATATAAGIGQQMRITELQDADHTGPAEGWL